ncbi:15301_t:CDS:2, partial [Gigaspora rosea]
IQIIGIEILSAWRKLNDWDIYWIGNQPPSSSITKQNSHSALADELSTNDAENIKIWETKGRISSLMLESNFIDLESEVEKASDLLKERNTTWPSDTVARRGFQLYSDMEFDSVERERKRLKADDHNYEKPQSQSIDDSEMLPVKADLVSASSKPLKILSTGSFADLRQEGGYYLDKTQFITKIEYLNALFEEDFHKSLNVDMTKFMCRYRQELKDYYQVLDKKESALVNFKELLNAVELSEHKLYIFIDEYDAGMTEALKNEYTLQPLIAHHKNSPSRTEVIESSFKQFYSRLKSACDDSLVYVFQTGVTPIVMAEFTSGFNISEDLALNKKFWDILPDNIKEELITWLKNENDGYFFHPRQPEGIFNTARVLYSIRKFLEQKEESDNSWNSLITHDALLDFPFDPQTLPSQISLDLIVNNPLGKSILTEALARHPLEFKDGIAQRFRLTNIRELATDRAPLLSFMFYIGAITEALKIYDWKEDDLIPVRGYLQILEADNNIEPLCRFIENTLLKPLKDNSIVHSNEEALKQAFMDAMILTLHADIEPEFQVYSQSPDLYGMAIDLVKTTGSTGKRIAIEFDNIQMKKILLDGANGRWQDATKVSRSLLGKSEEEILGLKIDDEHRKGQKTVAEALEYKINTKKKYLGPLSKRNDADLKSVFIVLRR